jgi:FkbM family methyltransferase
LAQRELGKRLAQAGKAVRLLARPTWRRGLRYGVAATIEHRPLERLVRPRTVVDIGANKGQFTLFALVAFPGCRIHAFEPLPDPAARFRRVLGDVEEVTLHERAVGPEEGEAVMHVSTREDSSSLLPISERMEVLFPGTAECGTRQIRVAPLASELGPDDIVRPALLKLDVQGYELEALKGCESLFPCFDWVYAECSEVELYKGQAMRADIEAFLRQHGFIPEASLNRTEREGVGLVQCDVLFSRRQVGYDALVGECSSGVARALVAHP